MPSEPAAESRWSSAMREALADAQSPDAPFGVNPRVGCVIVSPQGVIVGRGHHRGAGTPHAEVMALADAGQAARGATAVVTLEPCSHTGRTGPCTTALVEAGVAGVVYGQADPRTGCRGSKVLRAAGLDVVGGVLAAQCGKVNEAWTFAFWSTGPWSPGRSPSWTPAWPEPPVVRPPIQAALPPGRPRAAGAGQGNRGGHRNRPHRRPRN
jgi:pyrimidine deaminase RibD-like protein